MQNNPPVAPDGLWRVFRPQTCRHIPQTPENPSQTVKSPFYSVRRSCSGLCSGFTVIPPMFQKAEEDRNE